jgi:hypothetical protein
MDWIGLAPVAGSYVHDNSFSGAIKGGEFLEKLIDY